MKRGIPIVLAVLLIAAAGVITYMVSGDRSSTRARKDCLYAAVSAYPSWPEANGPVMESLTECTRLPVQDRTELRSMMNAFVNQAIARMKKEG